MKFIVGLGMCEKEETVKEIVLPKIVLDVDGSNIEDSKQKIKSGLNKMVDELFEAELKEIAQGGE